MKVGEGPATPGVPVELTWRADSLLEHQTRFHRTNGHVGEVRRVCDEREATWRTPEGMVPLGPHLGELEGMVGMLGSCCLMCV